MGRVSVEQIDKLIVGCVWRNKAELEDLIESYRKTVWTNLENGEVTQEQILTLVEQLEGKIEMPRLENPPRCPAVYYGHRWVESSDEVIWLDMTVPQKETPLP